MCLFGLQSGSRHTDQLERIMLALGLQSAMNDLSDATNVLRRATDRCLACQLADECQAWQEANV